LPPVYEFLFIPAHLAKEQGVIIQCLGDEQHMELSLRHAPKASPEDSARMARAEASEAKQSPDVFCRL